MTEIGRLRAALLRWYAAHRRELPWRRTTDPYAIWVAEIMLQQTRVATVIPYYERFLERFPDTAALASSDEDEVLSLWSGLGYYRRARALRAGALAVMERHGGRLPRDVRSLVALPGIGRYTAGAIVSTAFGQPAPVLDGNVRRVLARWFALDAARVGRAAEQRRLWELAERLVAGPRPGELNQALMELGALVCLPRRPDCPACPVAVGCRARIAGRVEDYPAPAARPEVSTVPVAVAFVVRGGHLLLERQGTGPLRGRWDLPAREGRSEDEAARALREGLAREHGLVLAMGQRAARVTHSIMNRRLRIEVYSCKTLRPGRSEALRWVRARDLGDVPVSGATRKVVLAVRGHSSSRPRSRSWGPSPRSAAAGTRSRPAQ